MLHGDGNLLESVMITGATGFLGSKVVQLLNAHPSVRRVAVATHRQSMTDLAGSSKLELLTLSLTDGIRMPEGIRTIIHAAGEKHEEDRMWAINEAGTRWLADAAAKAGVQRFVYVSSVGVYGAPWNSGLVSESFPHTPVNPYEASKNAGEVALKDSCSRSGMAYLIVQPANVIGIVPGRYYPLRALTRIIRAGFFTWFGRASAWMNYVDVTDAAAAIVAAAESAPSGQAYIVNCPAPLADVVRWIAEESGVNYPRRRLPLSAGRTAASIGSFLSRISGRAMPLDLVRFRELTNDTRYDPSRLVMATGFKYPMGAEAMFRGLARIYQRDGVQ